MKNFYIIYELHNIYQFISLIFLECNFCGKKFRFGSSWSAHRMKVRICFNFIITNRLGILTQFYQGIPDNHYYCFKKTQCGITRFIHSCGDESQYFFGIPSTRVGVMVFSLMECISSYSISVEILRMCDSMKDRFLFSRRFSMRWNNHKNVDSFI